MLERPRPRRGSACGGHIATTIAAPSRAGREPVLCRRWVPGFATACDDCGAPSARVKIGRVVDDGLRFMGALGEEREAPPCLGVVAG